jgi:hypothetical protein
MTTQPIAGKKEMDFTLDKIDVTFKPQFLLNKGISSVPVVEVGKDRPVGNATAEPLAGLIRIGLARLSSPLGVA